ncbi:MAG TPA: hypothetical protein VII65_08055 [Acidimicrobiales bacterium]
MSESTEQLGALLYATKSGDFVRFRSDPADETIGAIVRSVTSQGAEGCEDFRRELSEAGSNTLRLFAMRRTLQARRNASLSLISEAMDCYALLPRIDDVPWDSWFKGTLFVARSLALDIESLRDRFAELASSDAIKRGDAAIESMSRVDSLFQCQLSEVTTTYGTGFLELLVFNFFAKAGWLGNRRLAVNDIDYQPTTNLAQVAVNLADSLDSSGRLVVGPIGQDQLAATTFSLSVPGSYLPTTGCLSFIAEGADAGPSFCVVIAEMTDDADIPSLAAAATDIDDQAAIFDSRRLIVMSAQPNFEDMNEADADVDFYDYERLALVALEEATNSQWKSP